MPFHDGEPVRPPKRAAGGALTVISQLVRSTRPRQWVKNVFVLAALVFSGHLLEVEYALTALAATAAFLVTSAAVYLINDVTDARQDRLHPEKSKRPVACGVLPVRVASTTAILLMIVGLGTSWFLQPAFAGILATYAALNLAYSFGLKHAFLVDILMVAAGFFLRAMGGAVAIDVAISTWFILCTFTLTLFLAAAKRRGELELLREEAAEHRPALAAYEIPFLDQVIGVLASATIVCYALYATGVGEGGLSASRWMQWTIPFVLYGVLRYLYLVHSREAGGDPTALLWRDRPLQLTLVLWAALSFALLYGPSVPAVSGQP